MEMEKIARYALGRFHNTYREPADIEKSFSTAIKRMAAENSRQFAEEVYASMHFVTVDVIRSRISSDKTWQDIASGEKVDKKKEDFHYRKLITELMKVLVGMQYSEYKKKQKKDMVANPQK